MSGTPLFLITDAGLATASVANPQGPFIHITSFQIGSGYGYEPQRSDPGLNGNLLYSGVPTAWENIGNNTINIICEIPPDAGPFDFGEVAVFLAGGVMFAKAVFDTPQTKFSSLGTNVVSSYTLNCLLKLQQSTAVFQIDTVGPPPAVLDVFQWSDVYPPGVSANPDVPLYIVRELDERGDSTLLQNTSDSYWSVGTSYGQYTGSALNNSISFPVANSSTTWVEFAANRLHPADITSVNRRFLLETPDGFFRSVNNVVVSGGNYRFNLNCSNDGTYNNLPLLTSPAIGQNCRLYRDDQAGGSIYYSQIIDPPPLPLATVGTPGLAYGGNGLYMPSAGVIEAHGLLHAPSTNTGRILTSADDLNNLALNSGAYIVSSGAFGFPANMPISYDGHIWMQNYDGLITQLYWPAGSGGGASPSGVGGYPPYYRSWQSSVGAWSNWFPFSMQGKIGGGNGVSAYGKATAISIVLPSAGTWTIVGWAYGHQSVWGGAQLYINGALVDQNLNHGDQEGTGYGIMTGNLRLTVGVATSITVQANWTSLFGPTDVSTQAIAFLS